MNRILKSQLGRRIFLAAVTATTVAVILTAAWLLRPYWLQYRAVQSLIDDVSAPPPPKVKDLGSTRLYALAPGPKERVAARVRAIWDPEARESAVRRLAALSQHADPHVRWLAVYALRRLGSHSIRVVPPLSACLDDTDERVRIEAAVALCELSPDDVTRLIEILASGLKSSNPDVLKGSLRGLALTGDYRIVPLLIDKLYFEDDDEIQIAAREALCLISRKFPGKYRGESVKDWENEIANWKAWYRSVRPGHDPEDLSGFERRDSP